MNENFEALKNRINSFNKASLNIDVIVLFSTDNKYSGNLGGRQGADEICNNQVLGKTLAKFLSSCSNIRAFISVDNNDQLKDMPLNYSIPEKKIIVSNAGNILVRSWNELIGQQLEYDLFSQNIGNFYSWSGSDSDGELSASNCDNWSSEESNVQGTMARTDMTQNNWLAGGNWDWCSSLRQIMCVCY